MKLCGLAADRLEGFTNAARDVHDALAYPPDPVPPLEASDVALLTKRLRVELEKE